MFVSVGLSLGLALGVAACSGDTPNRSAAVTEEQLEQRAETIGTNPFIPENANIGDCVSSMPRPECGSEARSSTGQWLTFGVLMAGMAFIGWRIFRGVRKNDGQNDGQNDSTSEQPVGPRPGR